jgi:hypothetical protein
MARMFAEQWRRVEKRNLHLPIIPQKLYLQAHHRYVYQIKILQTSTRGKKCGYWIKKEKGQTMQSKESITDTMTKIISHSSIFYFQLYL